MTFEVGDKVIYPNQGVGVVEDVCDKTIAGHTDEYYTVRLTASESTVMVPVANVENVGVRRLSSERQIKKLYRILKGGFEELETDWKSRYKFNLEKMNSGEVCEVAIVLKNLFLLSFKKSLSFREKKMYDRARDLVISEIATVRDQEIEETQEEVNEILNAAYQSMVEKDGQAESA